MCKVIILLPVIIFYACFKANAAERINPFKPFLKDNLEQAEDIKRNQEDINPLLSYDISQLRLTAILQSKNKRFALLEDNTGRGYIILEGNRVGTELYSVVDILQDKVIIKNIFGVKREIVLNKEAEE
ncbi:MAG: pilus assembly protein PilP [Deltaproteobacteria bacterium]|nr:pilus assembly protein PilP [Deltaproteobacteria bacterium]